MATAAEHLKHAERLAEAERRARPGSSERQALRASKLRQCQLALEYIAGHGHDMRRPPKGCVGCRAQVLLQRMTFFAQC